ncbi:MAG: hypothetical protein ABI706_07700 [Ilumatobacteraceae bacterium]
MIAEAIALDAELDSLGDDLEAQRLGEVEQALNDRRAPRFVGDRVGETPSHSFQQPGVTSQRRAV